MIVDIVLSFLGIIYYVFYLKIDREYLWFVDVLKIIFNYVVFIVLVVEFNLGRCLYVCE